MKTEQKYFFFWLSLLSLYGFYFILILIKFSSLSIQHLVQTCITGMISIIHFSIDIVPFMIFPLAGLGIIAIALKVLFSYLKTRTKMQHLAVQQVKQKPIKIQTLLVKHGFGQHEILIVRSDQSFVYTIGIWSSKIVLSSSLINALSVPELEAVILHERHHQQRAHTLLFFIGEIANSILFMLPIFDDILISMKLKLEAEADKSVIAFQKTTKHLLAALQTVTLSPVARYYPGFASYRLEDRVGLIIRCRPRHRSFSLRKTAVTLSVVVISLAVTQIPTKADTSLRPQIEQRCDNSATCTDSCPAASFPMQFGH